MEVRTLIPDRIGECNTVPGEEMGVKLTPEGGYIEREGEEMGVKLTPEWRDRREREVR